MNDRPPPDDRKPMKVAMSLPSSASRLWRDRCAKQRPRRKQARRDLTLAAKLEFQPDTLCPPNQTLK